MKSYFIFIFMFDIRAVEINVNLLFRSHLNQNYAVYPVSHHPTIIAVVQNQYMLSFTHAAGKKINKVLG